MVYIELYKSMQKDEFYDFYKNCKIQEQKKSYISINKFTNKMVLFLSLFFFIRFDLDYYFYYIRLSFLYIIFRLITYYFLCFIYFIWFLNKKRQNEIQYFYYFD